MNWAGKVLTATSLIGIFCFPTATSLIGIFCFPTARLCAAAGSEHEAKRHPRVITDGRLRPGHLERIRVLGFSGKGAIGVSFFPTAICEDECGARTFSGGSTNADGAATFRVRVPGTFFDEHNRPTYFRNGERIDVALTWEGPDHSFEAASAEPDPVIVRTHGSHRG